ncbi:hypothetical protein [Actinophytocola gossypii]|uniref:DUF8017 domain-containing protein n=1 Tax=Actinophytocola gossypii TaxID=2812003 RepID=A0ABT2J3I8_9PSEU|nr:hypothetical protein [Actinophytocola gossypii]MCT2582411.1 hypothetical protein [Actinophytocola gossypii]
MHGWPPPPPPPPSRLPMILGVLAITLIVGAVVTIALVNRKSGGTPTAAPTAAAPATTTSTETDTETETEDGWRLVDNTADAGLTYQVPDDWKVVPDKRDSGLGVDFTGTADHGSYTCQGQTYIRSFATSGDVRAKDGSDLDLAKTVREFATSFATGSFKAGARVEVGKPQESELDGRPAMTLTAKVTPRVTIPECQATEGEIAILGVALAEDGEPTGVTMLVVVSDVAGGPAEPAPLPTSVAQDILASAAVS